MLARGVRTRAAANATWRDPARVSPLQRLEPSMDVAVDHDINSGQLAWLIPPFVISGNHKVVVSKPNHERRADSGFAIESKSIGNRLTVGRSADNDCPAGDHTMPRRLGS